MLSVDKSCRRRNPWKKKINLEQKKKKKIARSSEIKVIRAVYYTVYVHINHIARKNHKLQFRIRILCQKFYAL